MFYDGASNRPSDQRAGNDVTGEMRILFDAAVTHQAGRSEGERLDPPRRIVRGDHGRDGEGLGGVPGGE